jgi:hypothetical protein
MSTIVIYYSYTGNTKKYAEDLANECDSLCGENADILELQYAKPLSKPKAYALGSFAAMRRKCAELKPLGCDLAKYDKIIIAMPIWASHPAPPINNVIAALPSGKDVELIMISASGNSGNADKTKALIEAKGCTVTKYADVKMH